MIETEKPREVIDHLVNTWKDIVVPLYGQVNSNINLDGIGSGFLVEYKGLIFFVTCHHVVKELNKTDGVVGFFNGRGIELSKLAFMGDISEDIVVALLDHKWAAEKNLERVKAFPLIKDKSDYDGASYNFFMGYPCSKNKLKKNLNKFDRFLHSYSISDADKLASSSMTKIQNHTAFDFDINSMSDTNETPKRPPNLNGVSGGPLFSVLRARSNINEPTFALELSGVFSEWRNKKKEIVFVNKSVVIESIEHWLA